MLELDVEEAGQKRSVVLYAVKGNALDLHLHFVLVKTNIVNEFKYLMSFYIKVPSNCDLNIKSNGNKCFKSLKKIWKKKSVVFSV